MSDSRMIWSLAFAILVACQARSTTDAKTATDDTAREQTSLARPEAAASPASSTLSAPSPNARDLSPSSEAPAKTAPNPAALQTTASLPNAASLRTAEQDPSGVPKLVDATGNPLPQTEDEPSVTSGAFEQRLQLLVQAIAKDDPALALPSFFPVEAYKQVKAIAKPEQDWQRRLVAAFERNVHQYHRQLGSAAEGVRFVRLDVPAAKVKWMKPGSEGNRVGYFRVLRSKLVLATASGDEIALEVTSMISWRGEWYVVHLHGFE